MYKYTSILALTLATSAICFSQEAKNNFQEDLYAVNDTVKNKKGEVLQEVVIISQQQKTIER